VTYEGPPAVVFTAPDPAAVADAEAPVADDGDGADRRSRSRLLPAAAGEPLDAR
jgi:hypothetical protein